MFEIFGRKMTRTTDPMVTMMETGRIALNKTASGRLHEKAIDHVLLLWNKETRQVGVKPYNKRDARSYKVSFSGKGNSGAVSAITFFRHIEYKMDRTQSYPVNWSDDDSMFIFTIPTEHLGGARRSEQPRTAAPVSTQTRKMPPKERPVAAASLTQ
jgi:hypothetical protein